MFHTSSQRTHTTYIRKRMTHDHVLELKCDFYFLNPKIHMSEYGRRTKPMVNRIGIMSFVSRFQFHCEIHRIRIDEKFNFLEILWRICTPHEHQVHIVHILLQCIIIIESYYLWQLKLKNNEM